MSSFLTKNVAYLVAIWGLGVLFFAFRWCSMLLATSRMRKRGTSQLSVEWQERLLALKKRMGISRNVGIAQSVQVDTPLVIGYFKPIILLPIGLINGLTTNQVEAILAHELAHVGRRDFLINVLLTGLEIVLFYHPVYWWLMARINEEREKCCDDVAVATCGNPRVYARTLLSVEEYRQSGGLALAFAGKGGQLQDRIHRICRVTPRHHRAAPLRMWLLLPLVGFAAAFTYAGVAPAKLADNQAIIEKPAPSEIRGDVDAIELKTTPAPETTVAVTNEEPTVRTVNDHPPVTPLPTSSLAVPILSVGDQMPFPELRLTANSSALLVPDSLPNPVIPQMTKTLVLPTAPAFEMTTSQIDNLLEQGDDGRQSLRKATNDYRDQISDWNNQLDRDYLRPWGKHRERIMDAYHDWNKKLRAQSADELSYALAHEEKVHAFKEALEQHENTLEKAEDTIEEQPEEGIEKLEEAVERGEKSIREHSDRMEAHSIRMGMHSARMQVHSGRMQVHSTRMQMHSARMKIHNERMASHTIIMEALEAELQQALIADGFLASGEEEFRFEVTSTSVTFNDKKIEPAELAQKYRDILARYGKGISPEDVGNKFMIHISDNGRMMGTSYDRN